MARPGPDQAKVDRAWELIKVEGKSLRAAAQILGQEFDCSTPSISTVRDWARSGKLSSYYLDLMNIESNRKVAAVRLTVLWAKIWEGLHEEVLSLEKAIDLGLKVNQSERKLFGTDAAAKIVMENTPPGPNPEILAALRAMNLQDMV
jgi:hypothetical protein